MHRLLAERRILSPSLARCLALNVAQPLFHGISVFVAEKLGAFEAAEGVQIVAIDKVLGRLLLAVVEVIPSAEQFAAVGFG